MVHHKTLAVLYQNLCSGAGGKKAKETEEAAGRAAKQAERKGTQVLKGAQRQAKEAPKRGTQVLKASAESSTPFYWQLEVSL